MKCFAQILPPCCLEQRFLGILMSHSQITLTNFNVPIEVMVFIFYSDEISIDVKTGLVTRHKNYFFYNIVMIT